MTKYQILLAVHKLLEKRFQQERLYLYRLEYRGERKRDFLC